MKKVFHGVLLALKYALLVLMGIEVISFLIITVANFVLYGHAREGSRAVYDPYTVFLQSDGVRPTTGNSRSEDARRNRVVWCFGGSTMRGATDDDSRTIPSQLARLLNAESGGVRFTVINYGVNSFNSLLEAKYLQKLLAESPDVPDLVIFYDGANEAKYFAENRSAYAHHGYRKVKALVESYYRSWFGLLKPLNAAVYASFAVELYDKINQTFVGIDPDDPELKRMIGLAERRYDHVNRIVQAYGANFVLFWQPMWWIEDCDVCQAIKVSEESRLMTPQGKQVIGRNFAIPYDGIEHRLKGKPYFVEFRHALCGRMTAAYSKDGVHLLDQGREMIAERMKEVVTARLFKSPCVASGNAATREKIGVTSQ